MTDSMEIRRVGVAALTCFAIALVAAFGWGNHWNAYTNLALTLGDLGLWATLWAALRPRTLTFTATPLPPLKIPAIKAIRTAAGVGLREAKEATEGHGLKIERKVALALVAEMKKLGVPSEVHRG